MQPIILSIDRSLSHQYFSQVIEMFSCEISGFLHNRLRSREGSTARRFQKELIIDNGLCEFHEDFLTSKEKWLRWNVSLTRQKFGRAQTDETDAIRVEKIFESWTLRLKGIEFASQIDFDAACVKTTNLVSKLRWQNCEMTNDLKAIRQLCLF